MAEHCSDTSCPCELCCTCVEVMTINEDRDWLCTLHNKIVNPTDKCNDFK